MWNTCILQTQNDSETDSFATQNFRLWNCKSKKQKIEISNIHLGKNLHVCVLIISAFRFDRSLTVVDCN